MVFQHNKGEVLTRATATRDGSWKHCAKWKEPDTKGNKTTGRAVAVVSPSPEQADLQRQVRQRLPGAEGGEVGVAAE